MHSNIIVFDDNSFLILFSGYDPVLDSDRGILG